MQELEIKLIAKEKTINKVLEKLDFDGIDYEVVGERKKYNTVTGTPIFENFSNEELENFIKPNMFISDCVRFDFNTELDRRLEVAYLDNKKLGN